MRVVFEDVRRATYKAVEGVVQIDSCQFRIQGKLTNVWFLHMESCTSQTYPQRHYKIYRIEA